MIKAFCIVTSTFLIIVSCYGAALAATENYDPDKALYFLSVAIVSGGFIGYQLMYKDWRLKKTFVCLHVVPILWTVWFYFI